MRIPSREALGAGSDAKTVEIAKGVMPTIALHLIRQPKGGSVDDAEDAPINTIYAVVSRQGALHRRAASTRPPASATSIAMPCWHAHTIEAPQDTVVFKVSDEPIFEKLGLARTAN